jgi:hypothetical protein
LYEPLAYAGFRQFDSAAVAFDLFSEHHGGRGRWNSPTRKAPRAATLVVARCVSGHRGCFRRLNSPTQKAPRAATRAVACLVYEHRRCLEDGIQKNGWHPRGVPMAGRKHERAPARGAGDQFTGSAGASPRSFL